LELSDLFEYGSIGTDYVGSVTKKTCFIDGKITTYSVDMMKRLKSLKNRIIPINMEKLEILFS